MIKKYICEKCRKEFNTEEECLKCESSHIKKITRYSVSYGKIFPLTEDDELNVIKAESQGIPTHLKVEWENYEGRRFIYKLSGECL